MHKGENVKTICFCITGAIFEIEKAKESIKELRKKYNIIPIVSEFTIKLLPLLAEDLKNLTGNDTLSKIEQVERICPNGQSEGMVIYPCTGNTLSKIANGISDSVVSFLAKSHQRNSKPVLIGLSTNDGLGLNLYNIAKLMNAKDIYFIPFYQDDYIKKPKSLVCQKKLIALSLKKALSKEQLQPVLWR